MKLVLVLRDGAEGDYLYKKISIILKNKVELFLIKESGLIAKKKKIRRILKTRPFYALPLRIVDLISIQIFNSIFGLKSKNSPTGVATFDDINQEECINKINSLFPDMVVIFGTGIVTAGSIGKIKCPIYNIHTGVLPHYRNVYSEFWALLNKDYKNIGSTVIKIDTGVDTGSIFKVGRVEIGKETDYRRVKEKNLDVAIELVSELVKDKISKKNIKLIVQDSSDSKSYPTPGLSDIVKYLWFSARK